MSSHSIPTDIDLYILSMLCFRNIGRSFFYDGGTSTPPTSVTFTPDLSSGEIITFNGLVEVLSAHSNFKNLPNWATWTATEAESFVSSNIFNGLTQAQVDSQIDALPATIAGMKTGLKQASAAILSIRSILMAMAKAIVYLRNLIVTVRQ